MRQAFVESSTKACAVLFVIISRTTKSTYDPENSKKYAENKETWVVRDFDRTSSTLVLLEIGRKRVREIRGNNIVTTASAYVV